MDGFAYIDIARTGESNMAIDRMLLEAAEREQRAWVRLYRWSEPTLSLGRFQATLDRNIHAPSAQLPSVLRASGGGAIVHHHEWTYSIAVPVGRNQVGAATHLYDLVHDALVSGLRSFGWDAAKWTPACALESQPAAPAALNANAVVDCSRGTAAGTSQPFLCFSRRSCGDIVCNGFKVVGSAQRRHGASVLQHGSILFARSEFAPELAGLADLSRVPAEPSGHVAASEPADGVALQAKQDFESERFAGVVQAWLVEALRQKLALSISLLPSPPEFERQSQEASASSRVIG